MESFNGRLRDECLSEHLFANLRHARDLISAWRDDYNHHRPHTSLDGLTPWEYHQRSVEGQSLNRANQRTRTLLGAGHRARWIRVLRRAERRSTAEGIRPCRRTSGSARAPVRSASGSRRRPIPPVRKPCAPAGWSGTGSDRRSVRAEHTP
ncbi:hypothetical protein BV379_00820 [Rhodovulum sulfidophilum]|nr:hypothetical protein BV379_00820 [Rhodovulum sulfidophilum]